MVNFFSTLLQDYVLWWIAFLVSMAVFVLGENHFRKCFSENDDVWLVRKIEFFENWYPLAQKKWLWLRKSFYTFIFTSKYFRKKRERESECAIVDDRAPVQSDDRWRTPSSSSCRSRKLQSVDRDRCRRSRSRDVDRNLAKIAISPLWVRAIDQRRDCVVDRDRRRGRRTELAKHRAVEPSRASIVDNFFSGFCWVCLFLLFSQKLENIFRKFFWNVTEHMKIFSFSENSISGK